MTRIDILSPNLIFVSIPTLNNRYCRSFLHYEASNCAENIWWQLLVSRSIQAYNTTSLWYWCPCFEIQMMQPFHCKPMTFWFISGVSSVWLQSNFTVSSWIGIPDKIPYSTFEWGVAFSPWRLFRKFGLFTKLIANADPMFSCTLMGIKFFKHTASTSTAGPHFPIYHHCHPATPPVIKLVYGRRVSLLYVQ